MQLPDQTIEPLRLPTVYSQTTKGQVQEWVIEVEGATYRTHEGMVGGKITTSKPTVCKGKNTGKANATTPEQQAMKQAKAKWVKKMESGFDSPDNIATVEAKFFEPMLAQNWKDQKQKVEYPAFAQPKLDGMRCVISRQGMFSRKGKPILSAPHIFRMVAPLLEMYDLVIDGELYSHAFNKDFEEIISLAKKTKPTPEDLAASAEKLQYHVYDAFFRENPNQSFIERFQALNIPAIQGLPMIMFVKTVVVRDETEVVELDKQHVSEGYEGTMVRWGDRQYEVGRRSERLLKVKTFIEEEFELVDLEDGLGNRVDLATRAILKLEDGRTFEAGVMGKDAYVRQLLIDKAKVIGKPCTVKYQNLTADGIPRMAKLKIVRDYE